MSICQINSFKFLLCTLSRLALPYLHWMVILCYYDNESLLFWHIFSTTSFLLHQIGHTSLLQHQPPINYPLLFTPHSSISDSHCPTYNISSRCPVCTAMKVVPLNFNPLTSFFMWILNILPTYLEKIFNITWEA